MDHIWTDAQIRFAEAFERATIAAMMYVPGELSGMWDHSVNLTVRPNARDNYIELSSIQAMPVSHGHGGRALQWLCNLADQHRLILKAYPQPFGLTAQSPLREAAALSHWYMRRGFQQDGHVLKRTPI